MFMNRYSELIYEQSFHSTAVLCFSYNNGNVYGRKKEQIITQYLWKDLIKMSLYSAKKMEIHHIFSLMNQRISLKTAKWKN